MLLESMPSPSPFKDANDSPSRDSPSRTTYIEDRRFRTRREPGDPRSRSPDLDSPSRQIIEEFARLLVDNDRQRRDRLERDFEEKRKDHDAAIENARAEHDKVREAALRLKQQLELEAERIRLAKEEYEIRELARVRRETEAQHAQTERTRLQVAEQAREDEERQRKESANAEAREREKRAQHEANLKQIDDDARAKAQAEVRANTPQPPAAVKEASAPQLPIAQPQPTAQQPITATTSGTATPTSSTVAVTPAQASPLTSSNAQRDAEHQKYLELHKRLKAARALVKDACRQSKRQNASAPLSKIEEMRRELQKTFGQLSNPSNPTARAANMQVRNKVKALITAAQQIPHPTVNARDYILNTSTIPPETNSQIPASFIYLINFVAKQAMSQWTESVSRSYPASEPIGVLVAAMIADPTFAWNNLPFSDIVLAKFHASCPLLFGIWGKEKTENGRQRMRWPRNDRGWVDELAYYERMSSIAAGWASITLRNFTKAKSLSNSFPNWWYWRTVAMLVNIPGESLQPSHFAVLKALLDQGYARKFIELYGKVAVVVVRKAVVEITERAPASAQREGLRVLRDSFRASDVLGLDL